MRTDYGYFEEEKLGKPYDIGLLKRLYPFTRPYRTLFLITICIITLITLLDLALPYVTKVAIDRYIVPRESGPARQNTPDPTGEKIRYYRVDTSDPVIRGVVEKYPNRFKRTGTEAAIPYDRLADLNRSDLVRLRRSDFAGIGLASAALLLLVLANFALTFLQTILMEYAGQRIMHDLRMSLFSHIQGLSVTFFTRNPVGRLVTRVTNDVQNMNELFTSVIVFIFKDLFLLVGIAVVLLGIDLKLALISFTVLPVVIFAAFKFAGLAREAFRTLRIKVAEINTRFSETLGGISVIQLFNGEETNLTAFKRINHENYLAGMRQIEVFAVFMPFIELLGAVAIAVVILYGGAGVQADRVSLGALVAFISYIRMFFRPIRDIAEKYNVLQNAMASAERIFQILDTSDSLPAGATAPAELGRIRELSVESAHFAYVENEPVLKDVSFRVRAGETLAVVGPTGSGKTTLIHLMIRFYDPIAGRIRINGRDIRGMAPAAVRSKIALVTQDPFLFSTTIRENIAMGGGSLSDAALEKILAASNCKDLVDRLPEGVDTRLSEGGGSLSSGERQLISIARAFARNPELIILDEATSYIDSETEHQVQEALANLMTGRTSVLIAHRLSTARTADRILVLYRGQIIESGTHPELMARQGLYFQLTRLQAD